MLKPSKTSETSSRGSKENCAVTKKAGRYFRGAEGDDCRFVSIVGLSFIYELASGGEYRLKGN